MISSLLPLRRQLQLCDKGNPISRMERAGVEAYEG